VAEHERVADSLGPLLQLTLTGGSPELRPDLPDVTEAWVRRTRPVNVTFCMNGYHTERIVRHIQDVLARMPEQTFTVGLSLDGLGEEHDRLRGMPGLFERLQATFWRLGALREGARGRLRLTAAITVSGLNHASAEATARWARANLPIDVLKPILVRGSPKDPRTLEIPHRERWERVVSGDDPWLGGHPGHATAYGTLVDVKELVQRDLIDQIQRTGRSPVTCAAGRETAVILPHGVLRGCEPREELLGDLRAVDLDLGRLWRSPDADHFRASTGQHPTCEGCFHHCFHSPPLFRTPSLWPKMLAAAARCLAT
jgi:MoaA/NifB/PqqE/SkfB family radical SAM enzyme